MAIEYDYKRNLHTLAGARTGWRVLTEFLQQRPRSLVDIGCGPGNWLGAALASGTSEVLGIDGVMPSGEGLAIDRTLIRQHDLTAPLDLGRRFDLALCLEVGEHLDVAHAGRLVENLVSVSDTVVFSAACPHQKGQHHVNCQWPVFWQSLFNARGYACDDGIRRRMWHEREIEPWYRQNAFIARRDPERAGKEPRILPMLHPDMVGYLYPRPRILAALARSMARNWSPPHQYVTSAVSAVHRRVRKSFG